MTCSIKINKNSFFIFATCGPFCKDATHIAMVRNKLSRINGILHRLKYYFSQNILIILYQFLFTPHINYGLLLWGQAGENLDKLQKKTIKTITYNNYTAHTEHTLSLS